MLKRNSIQPFDTHATIPTILKTLWQETKSYENGLGKYPALLISLSILQQWLYVVYVVHQEVYSLNNILTSPFRFEYSSFPLLQTAVVLKTTEEVAEILPFKSCALSPSFKASRAPLKINFDVSTKGENFLPKTCWTPHQRYMVLITLAKILKNSVTNTFGLASVELNLTIPNLCALGLMLASLKSLSTTFLTPSTLTAVCPCLWSRRGLHRVRSTLSLWLHLPSRRPSSWSAPC